VTDTKDGAIIPPTDTKRWGTFFLPPTDTNNGATIPPPPLTPTIGHNSSPPPTDTNDGATIPPPTDDQ
ncbi:unnamed protein product, partial [Staurois parvus]